MNRLLTVDQLAEEMHLARITVYKMVSARKIPHIKVGRRVFFQDGEIEDWLEQKKVAALDTAPGRKR